MLCSTHLVFFEKVALRQEEIAPIYKKAIQESLSSDQRYIDAFTKAPSQAGLETARKAAPEVKIAQPEVPVPQIHNATKMKFATAIGLAFGFSGNVGASTRSPYVRVTLGRTRH